MCYTGNLVITLKIPSNLSLNPCVQLNLTSLTKLPSIIFKQSNLLQSCFPGYAQLHAPLPTSESHPLHSQGEHVKDRICQVTGTKHGEVLLLPTFLACP